MKKIIPFLILALHGAAFQMHAEPTPPSSFTAPPLIFPAGVTLKKATTDQIETAVTQAIKNDPAHAKEIAIADETDMKDAGRTSQEDIDALVGGVLDSTSASDAPAILAAMCEAAPDLAPKILKAVKKLKPELLDAVNKILVETGGSGLQYTGSGADSGTSLPGNSSSAQNLQPTPTPTPEPVSPSA